MPSFASCHGWGCPTIFRHRVLLIKEFLCPLVSCLNGQVAQMWAFVQPTSKFGTVIPFGFAIRFSVNFGGCVNRRLCPHTCHHEKCVSVWRKFSTSMPMSQWENKYLIYGGSWRKCYVLCVCVCRFSFSFFCNMCICPRIYWDVQIDSHGLCLLDNFPSCSANIHWAVRID